MYSEILVPTDGSAYSRRAVRTALDLAADRDATVHGVYVVDTSRGPLPNAADLRGRLQETGERALADLADRASDSGVAVHTTLLTGTVHEQLLEYARDHAVDLVVMGTHGRNGLERYVLGSVTERVLRASDVPVLAVPSPEGSSVVADAEDAERRARDALRTEGYDDVAIVEEASRGSGSWVVRAASDDETFHVYVDRGAGTARVARD